MIKLILDGKEISAKKGQSILSAALDAGVYIPHLCHHPSLPDIGECKLCIVEIEGVEGVRTSCTTPAEDGMVIHTRTEQINRLRKLSMELMMAGHPSDCTSCPKYLKCEFQSLIQYLGVSDSRLRKLPGNNTFTDENPLIIRDLCRCVLCGRCVRACEEVRGVGVLSFDSSSGRTQIAVRGNGLLADGDCRFCGACVEVCPTGAILDKEELPGRFGTREAALVPCRSSCPAGADVPRYVSYVREGKYAEALAVIREKLPFPLTLGLVCMRFCEDACRRGCVNDPVNIREIKRVAAELGGNSWKSRVRIPTPSGKSVAVIGSGPAGLTAAYYLAHKGHKVDVYEKLPKAGGMLRYGIPSYRLPEDVLDSEISDILEAGIALHTNSAKSPADLIDSGADAVVVAVGAHLGSRLPIPGNDLPNTYTAVDFLRCAALGNPPELGDSLMIIGGGNVAFDVAGTAHRLGVKRIIMACLEPRDGMTASEEEILEGLEHGLELHNLRTFKRIENCGENLTVICENVTELGKDELGRMTILSEPGSEHGFTARSVVFAVGQKPEIEGFGLDAIRGLINAANSATSAEGVFACGDAVSGTSSVIQSIASARKAAEAADRYLGGNGDITEILIDPEEPSAYLGRAEGFAYRERIACLSADNSSCEADRCLRCHLRLTIKRPKTWNEYSESQVSK